MIQDKIGKHALCCFDVEGTGLNVSQDRIVTLAIKKIDEASERNFYFQVNPEIEMSDEVIAVHGITNDEVCDWEPFYQQARLIFDVINGCDLIGFNLFNYDIPILWEEFYRAGIEWNLNSIRVIDAGNIFKKKEERTLSAAVQFYLNKNHEGAHNAQADVTATLDVLNAQLAKYQDINSLSLDELAAYSRFDDRLDLAGKIVVGKDGRPTYNIGKVRGTAVEKDVSFAHWMLNKDFSANTKSVLRSILDEIADNATREKHSLDDEPPIEMSGALMFGPDDDSDVPF